MKSSSPSLHGYCYQPEMEKSTHTHAHTMMMKRDGEERRGGRDESVRVGVRGEDGRVRRYFSATGMINISLFFILLERIRNNFLLALTQTGIKPSFSL